MTAADRPPGVAPTWASDAVWAGTGDPAIDGFPTKTAPTIGIITQGWYPNEQPPPDRMNWLEDQLKRFGTYQDTMEVQNWDEGVAMGNSVATTEIISAIEIDAYNTNPSGSKYTGGRRIFVAAGNLIYASARGTKWVQEIPGSPPTYACMTWASSLSPVVSRNVLAAGDTANVSLWTASTRVWSVLSVAGTSVNHSSAIWVPAVNRFCVSGTNPGDTAPVIQTWLNDGTSNVAITMGLTGAHLSDFTALLVTSPTITAVAYANTDGTIHVPFFWTAASAVGTGSAWTLSQPTLTTESPGFAFFYDASRSLFFFISQDGHVYSTPDVVTFTDVGYSVPSAVLTGASALSIGSVAVRGPIWMIANSHGQLSFSVDAGQTWTQIPAPFVGDANDFQQFPMAYSFALIDRFAVAARATTNGTPHQISFSRRLR